jgi:putative aminopeptidase FrvX
VAADSTFDLIKTLTELPGPVGLEHDVQDWLADRWGAFCPEVRRTRVDNVLARVGGSGEKLLLLGHADEICYVVKSISEDGFVFFWPYYADTVGRPQKTMNPLGHPALIVTGNGNVEGIFATASGHTVSPAARADLKYEWNEWWIDLGLRSRDEVLALGVHPGCKIIWNPPTRRLGLHAITGKAMDDRVALAIVTMVGERLAGRDDLRFEVWLGSSVQEENGLIGASSFPDEGDFDRCIALDVALVGDVPGVEARDFPCKLGAGPVIVYSDSSVHYSWRFTCELVASAHANGIPVQQAVFQRYGSDGASTFKRGVATALVTYPTRYTHSPIETIDERDIEATVDLLVAYATGQTR